MRFFPVLFALMSSAAAADDFDLRRTLGSTQVDFLSYGMRALETELRVGNMEVCNSSGCRDAERKIRVGPLFDRPNKLPENMNFPEGGIIVISVEETRRGRDSSMATENGCKVALETQRMSGRLGAEFHPDLSYARFFVADTDWRSAIGKGDNSPIVQRMKAIEARMFFAITQGHEWQGANGLLDRAVWVSCAGSLLGADFAMTGRRQYPQ